MTHLNPPRRCAAALLLLLAGCAVGPDYAGPPVVATAAEGGAAFRRIGDLAVSPALAVAPDWWRALGDATLDRLIEQALISSPGIAIAEARLRRSRATAREQQANLLPQGNLNASYLRYRLPPIPGLSSGGGQAAGGAAESTDEAEAMSGGLWFGGFDASWEIDLFGGRRRARDQARAQAEAAEAQVADAQVSLAAEVAQAYIDLRSQQQLLGLASDASRYDAQSLALTEQLFGRGAASREDVARLRTQLAQSRSQETPLAAQIDISLDRLAVLIGREPGFLDAELTRAAPVPRVPVRLEIDDPATMLRRRPDVRAAERQIAAATAGIGVSTAQLFPSVSFFGLIGIGGPSLGDLSFDDYTAVGSPMLRWNFLNFGRVRARIRQSEASRDEAVAQYQQTVLAALQDAEQSLATFRGQRGASGERVAAERSATVAADLVRQRYVRGAASLIDLLDSQRQQVSARQQLAQTQAQLANGYVAIAKSLGLGWRASASPVTGRAHASDVAPPPSGPTRGGKR